MAQIGMAQSGSRKRVAVKALCAGALALVVGAALWPAQAQFFPFDDRFFSPRRYQKPRPVQQEQLNPPPPKKAEIPPTIRILVIGDSLADWLAFGLEEQLAETPEIGIVRKHRPYSGLIRYEQKSDTEWPKVARELIAAEKPQAIIMLVGLHDRQEIRERVAPKPAQPQQSQQKPGQPGQQPQAAAQPPAQQPQKPANPNDDETPAAAAPEQRARPAGPVEFRSEKWEELYAAKVDETIAALRTANVPVLWVGVPAVRGAKSTADLQYLNDIFRARVEKAGFIFVNVWDGFVDERGNFMQRGPDETGQIRQLRTWDGVNFTKFGARKLAHYVERDLKRVLREPIPAALTNVPVEPQPAKPAKPTGPTARPLAGPVILLGTPLQEPTDLAGGAPAKNAPANNPPPLDAVANRMLVKGEPQRNEAGRADDPAWPPRMPNLVATEPLPPTGAPLTIVRTPAPAAPAQQAAAPGQKPGVAPGTRVAGQQGQGRQQQAPTFWRRQAPEYSGPRFFFGLFGR
jgi:hypothetical protein